MRFTARPTDQSDKQATEKAATESAPRFISRANPKPTFAPIPPRHVPEAEAPAIENVLIPSWLQPFNLPRNTRFTRTPDYLLRQPLVAEVAPAVAAPEVAPNIPAPVSAAVAANVAVANVPVAPVRQAQTPILRVPPRMPPRGITPPQARIPMAAQTAAPVTPPAVVAAPEPEPVIAPVVEAAVVEAAVVETPVVEAPVVEAVAAPVATRRIATEWTPDEDVYIAANDSYAYEQDPAEEQFFEEDFVEEAFQPEPVVEDETGFDGYAVTAAEVSFSWPVFGVAAVTVAREEAPAPIVAPPAPVARPAPQPAAARPVPVAAPVPAPAAPPAPRLVRPESGTYEYELPPLELLTEPPSTEPDYELSEEFLDRNSVKLQQVLHDFGVRGEIIDANPGPVVTLYELEPAPGIKSSRVIGLSADIARSMSAISARVAVVEGRNVIGIELPNQRRETVWLREMLASQEFDSAKAKLGIGLGKTIGGEPVIVDLAKMPHLLVAGTTGSGKSVAINTMILSLLYRHRPEQCRLIMIDPKMLELSVYEGIPHLLTPVVTDPKKAIVALKWAVREMEERYKKMSRLGVRNIDGFNARVAEASARGEIITRTVQTGFDRETGQMEEEEEIMDLSPLPYIVIVVDEMADLMMVAGKEIEGAIQRLAQMARAAGIHLIMATQRPSVDVITGTIKANFPTRISFQVTSKIDSRTILGEMGAEQLLGQGDMLYMAGGGRISRVHGPFVSDQEVERVVEHLKSQGRPEYLEAVTAEDDEEAAATEESAVFDKGSFGEEGGDVYDQAVTVVLRDRKASTSYIQRRLQIGYNRAASIMERMENEGIVGPANHAGKRDILMDTRSGH